MANVIPSTLKDSSYSGLNLLRVLAIVLVTMQHALSLTNNDRLTTFKGFNLGQFGVSIFLGISGYLGMMSHRKPFPWLLQRLRRIYPAYWLVMLLAFFLTWVSGYKSFDIYQFASQMIGLGLFTHAGNLINVPTWFISLLLVSYLILFILRLTGWPLISNLVVLIAIFLLVTSRGNQWPWYHFTSFFLASTVAACPMDRQRTGLLISGAAAVLTSLFLEGFIYCGITLLLIGLSTSFVRTPRFITTISEYSYEYYLLHGICMVSVLRLLPGQPVIAITLGILIAAGSALILKLLVEFILNSISAKSRFRLQVAAK